MAAGKPRGVYVLCQDVAEGGVEMTLMQMAASYRKSADLIRVRVIALKDAADHAKTSTEKTKLEERIRELNILYRDTRETALVLERYYDGRENENGRME